MQSFLSKVVSEVLKQDTSLSATTFILPNKRAGLFLKNIFKQQLEQTTFLPRIISIEEFVKEISGFEVLDTVGLIFEFYGIYLTYTPKQEADSFESFAKWAAILLQDFNDLDSNLFDTAAILAYLSDSKRIEQWHPGESEESPLVKKYLAFFNKVITYHAAFISHLSDRKLGYQGLVYRRATESLAKYKESHQKEKFVFAAFNALNKAEETIIQGLLEDNLASIYWDHDDFYTKSNNQSEQFFKKYMRSWPYYISNDFKWQENNINSPKTIHFHGLPKNISQIKHVGSLLKDLHRDTGISDTALILGNEKLLPSLLNSIPKEIPKANITMGYELQNAPLNTFFQALFKLHLNRSKWNKEGSFYYRDLIAILNDPIIKSQWINHTKVEKGLREILYDDHVIFVSEDQLMRLIEDIEDLSELFQLIFLEWDTEVNLIIEKITKTIEYLKNVNEQYKLDQEYFYRYFNIFVQLSNLNKNFGFIDNLNTLYQIFQQLLKTEKLSFQGEPLEGLQIMGLLESRGLDFKNIIITSVNEGFLPASGSNNSFIPLDIKLEKKIPTFFEKDAIFSYHFFRLLHRAENVYLIYNSITDDFGSGEPSRFIRQLNAAKALGQLDKVQFRKKMISPKLNPSPLTLNKIIKTEKVMLKLSKLAEKGFSPSSLTNYIRNPLDFYKRSVLGIREFKEIEETIAANTFGTIVHDTLEQLYLPFINKTLQTKDVKLMIDLVDDEVTRQFKKSYSSKAITSGKNFLAFEIAKQFVINFLNFELSQLKQEKIIKILGLEVPIEIEHEVRGINMKVKLKGKIDRIDQVNGVYRIMDYKTGKVTKSQLKINEWELISSEERYNKSFQVLTYAYLYINKNNLTLEDLSLESGIISFKNLKDGFMPFNGSLINEELISSFVLELDKLISEIFDVSIPFQEKELPVFYF